MGKGQKIDENSPFFDIIESNILAGYSINDAAMRLKISAHSVILCVKSRPHLAEIAKENGKRKQRGQKH